MFTYLYDEDLEGQDTEEFKNVIRLQKGLEDIAAESNEPGLVNSSLQEQMESLDRIKQEIEDRQKARAVIEQAAEHFKHSNEGVAEVPDDYEEVLDRISEELINERKTQRLSPVNESTHPIQAGDSPDFLKNIQQKLMTTYYGFAHQPSTQDSVRQTMDSAYAKGIERIRELDKLLAEKEKEEKAVNETLRQLRRREQQVEAELRALSGNQPQANPSTVSNNSSKSDFFVTQNKKLKVPKHAA